jgi:hypothetical protein
MKIECDSLHSKVKELELKLHSSNISLKDFDIL